MTVEVAVIPAAGKGTRMRPATRVVPKPLLPIVDKPAIQYVVEEAARAGAKEVILIVDPGVGELVAQHFYEGGPLPNLENVTVNRVIQEEQLGLGDAIRTAESAVAHRPFFCLLADTISIGGGDVLADLAAVADSRSVVAVRGVDDEWLDRYGFVAPETWHSDTVLDIGGAVEKPGAEAAPSNLALIGRYVFSPDVFGHLSEQDPGYGNEIQLTDTIDLLARNEGCKAVVTDSEFLDMGNPLGYLEASTRLGMRSTETGPAYRRFLETLLEES